jgi:hypothetical protein
MDAEHGKPEARRPRALRRGGEPRDTVADRGAGSAKPGTRWGSGGPERLGERAALKRGGRAGRCKAVANDVAALPRRPPDLHGLEAWMPEATVGGPAGSTRPEFNEGNSVEPAGQPSLRRCRRHNTA